MYAMVVSEPYRGATIATRWNSNLCTIAVTASVNLVPANKGSGQGYAWVIIGSLLIVSCYCNRNYFPFKLVAFFGEVKQVIQEESGLT